MEWAVRETDPAHEPTQGLHKSTKTMKFLDELSVSDTAHPLSPTYLGSNRTTAHNV